MKVSVALGLTLNLGNYNSVKMTISFEDEYAEKELDVYAIQADVHGFPVDRKSIRASLTKELYAEIENELIAKISDFITRLDDEKLV